MRFQIVHNQHGRQVHIRIKGGNNENIVAGEQQHNVGDALATIMGMKEGAADAEVEEVYGDGTARLLWSPDTSENEDLEAADAAADDEG